MLRLEPNSSSEVEPYSGGSRLHLLLLDTEGGRKSVFTVLVPCLVALFRCLCLCVYERGSYSSENCPWSDVSERTHTHMYESEVKHTRPNNVFILMLGTHCNEAPKIYTNFNEDKVSTQHGSSSSGLSDLLMLL